MGLNNDRLVYITDNAAVYHLSARCTHLKLSIRPALLADIETETNENGSNYHACPICNGDKGSGGVVYITSSGDAYHSSMKCSGLTRNVYAVPISEVIGKGVCSRCGGK